MGEKVELRWKPDQMRLGDLKKWDKNPREISNEEALRLRQSLREFGQAVPLLVSPDGDLYDGHQRFEVWGMMSEFGEDMMVDVRVSNRPLEEKEREKLVVFLEKAKGDWNFDALANFFDQDDLLEWGFTEAELGLGKAEEGEDVEGEIEISPELFERYEYVVFYFENDFDWKVIEDLLELKPAFTAKVGSKSFEQRGMGRMINGGILLEKLMGVGDD